MELIDGKKVAAEIKQEIATEVAGMIAAGQRAPHLAAILVGHDGGSETYVANKVKSCGECGFRSSLIRFEDDVTEERLLEEIERLNADSEVDGFIVQLPLPRHISEQRIIEAIDYRKDVDGFHPVNVGRMAIGLRYIPSGGKPPAHSVRADQKGDEGRYIYEKSYADDAQYASPLIRRRCCLSSD